VLLPASSASVGDPQGDGYCALLDSGQVDCWGLGNEGELGNGKLYSKSPLGSSVPVAVEGLNGAGVLGGVTRLRSDGYGYCAVLASGGVDCWGRGDAGQLGNGVFYSSNTGSDVPVVVMGVGGIGNLRGVASLSSADFGFCAQLTSGEVDCWGYGYQGELGNGEFYTEGSLGSSLPVAVEGVAGVGLLTGVKSVSADSDGYCALLTAGKVDCWGSGPYGQLGNGRFYTSGDQGSAVPVNVKGVGVAGDLGGAADITSEGDSFCSRLTSGNMDCWGHGDEGQLRNGKFYTSGDQGSAVPVSVKAVGGTGNLGLVIAPISDSTDYGYCALLTSGKSDCWGNGQYGELGHQTFYFVTPFGSAVPVTVLLP
jgi:alpha-tubulin suppressor-like RCC1 family protein